MLKIRKREYLELNSKVEKGTKFKPQNTNGITLIALVITIIVLLILAGVTIAALSGDNGILRNAVRAKEETENAQREEQEMLNDIYEIMNNYSNGDTGDDEDNHPSKTSKYIVGYWENWHHEDDSDGVDLKLSEVPTGYDIVILGFVYGNSDGTVTFSLDQDYLGTALNYTEEEFKEDIKELQARGQKVILSIGGESATITVTNSSQANNFVSSVTNLIQEYDLDGIDIDIEQYSSPETLEKVKENPELLGNAIRQIRTNSGLGDDFVLTLCTETEYFYSAENPKNSSYDEYYYSVLSEELDDILTFSSIMLYNSGSQWGISKENGSNRIEVFQGTVEFGPAYVSRVIEEDGVDPSKLALCYKVTNVNNEGYLSPTKIVEALTSLIEGKTITADRIGTFTPPQAYSNFGGVVVWSINMDAKNSNAVYNNVINYLNS